MSKHITYTIAPKRIADFRKGFRLNHEVWAEILCVHPVTAAKWESSAKPCKVVGWPATVFACLAKMRPEQRDYCVDEVRQAYIHGDALKAISALANALRSET